MGKTVTVVDYGIGNIFSVLRAIERVGGQAKLTGDPRELKSSNRVILPGVGAYANGMAGLRERGMVEPIQEFAATGRPLLGICLGMQMLVTASEEFGLHEGLNLIPGRVKAIVAHDQSGAAMKVPHIGWSRLEQPVARTTWQKTILDGLNGDTTAYFVHSFTVVPDIESDRLADAAYGDCRISAAIQRDNVAGCQFHPEKSASIGLQIVKNFLEL